MSAAGWITLLRLLIGVLTHALGCCPAQNTGSDLAVDMMPAEPGQLLLHSIRPHISNIVHQEESSIAPYNATPLCLHRTRATRNQASRQQGLLVVVAAHLQWQVTCDTGTFAYLEAELLTVPPSSHCKLTSGMGPFLLRIARPNSLPLANQASLARHNVQKAMDAVLKAV